MASFRRLKGLYQFLLRLHKTTRAIKLVTLSKLQRLQKSIRSLGFPLILFSFFSSPIGSNASHLIVPIFTERSCCGPVDGLLVSSVEALVSGYKLSAETYTFFFLGKRGFGLLKKSFRASFAGLLYNMKRQPYSFLVSSVISSHLKTYNVDYIDLLFNKFKNVFIQNPSIYLVPSYSKFIDTYVNFPELFHLFKVNQGSSYFLLEDFYDFMLSCVILNSLKQNSFSELAGRVAAMDNAMKNLEELIRKTQLSYQKARQNSITIELIEIVACLGVLMEKH